MHHSVDIIERIVIRFGYRVSRRLGQVLLAIPFNGWSQVWQVGNAHTSIHVQVLVTGLPRRMQQVVMGTTEDL